MFNEKVNNIEPSKYCVEKRNAKSIIWNQATKTKSNQVLHLSNLTETEPDEGKVGFMNESLIEYGIGIDKSSGLKKQ